MNTHRYARIAAAKSQGVSAEEILGKSHRRRIAHARWHAWALAKAEGFNMSEIGEAFGVHHTTVMNGLRQHEAREQKNNKASGD